MHNLSRKPKVTRRNFLKLGGAAAAAALIPTMAAGVGEKPLKGKKLAMVIDLHRCTGCGGCSIACKNENNVQDGTAWASRISQTKGIFPHVKYEYKPTLCNHCDNAPCVRVCPTGAMHKDDGNITAHDPEICLGCKTCMAACPYGVIAFNKRRIHEFWRSEEQLLKGCTESPAQITKKAKGKLIPYYNSEKERGHEGSALRYKGIVEKCTFCDHRVKDGKLPWCVLKCPASARIFGDLNDPDSDVNKILGKFSATRLKEHLGTKPNIYYVRDFNPAHFANTRGKV